MLVLGAGACRLAYDLHQSLTPTLTVALDINPLFLLAAKRIVSGGALELYEFPIAPRTIADHAVLRTLTAPGHAMPGLELVLADAAAPPFLAGSFDLVLRTGGYWISQGSLAFAEAAPADAVSLEELLEWLPESGFSQATPQESVEAYLASPASRHARRETVITFCTCKEREVASPDQGRPVPEWLRRSDLPIPALPPVRAQALASRVHAFLLAMIDGERSIRDMARLMEQQQLRMAEDAEPAIRRFLARARRFHPTSCFLTRTRGDRRQGWPCPRGILMLQQPKGRPTEERQ